MQDKEIIEEYVSLEEEDGQNTNDFRSKWSLFIESRYFILSIVIFVAIISFCLVGFLPFKDKKTPIRIIQDKANVVGVLDTNDQTNNISSPTLDTAVGVQGQGGVVASKSGTKYHYPWCAGAKQISEKNKIFFNSIEEAKAKGYTPASNCKGLK